MKLIVGLGNPHPKYQTTRHNIGHLFIEYLAQKFSFSKKKISPALKHSQVISIHVPNEEPFLLVQTNVYMNTSGTAIQELIQRDWNHPDSFQTQDLLVVVDDVALTFGSVRLRTRGSAGGHNGLKSIEQALGDQNYPRLRLGVGPENVKLGEKPDLNGQALEDFVLNPFSKTEEAKLDSFFENTWKGCEMWLRGHSTEAMNYLNPSK